MNKFTNVLAGLVFLGLSSHCTMSENYIQKSLYDNSFCIRKFAFGHDEKGEQLKATVSAGTAFIYHTTETHSYLVTAAHVVNDIIQPTKGNTLDDIILTLGDNGEDENLKDDIPVRIVAIDNKNDIAILLMDGKSPYFQTGRIPTFLGQKTAIVGYADAEFNVYEQGKIVGNSKYNNITLIVSDNDAIPGNSGGPLYVFDRYGNPYLAGVISMTTGGVFTHSIPIAHVDKLFEKLQKNPIDTRKNLESVLDVNAKHLLDDPLNMDEYLKTLK